MLPDWTTMPSDDRDAMLADLVGKGLAHSAIAKHFRNASRNAVISKVHRLQAAGVLLKATARTREFTPEDVAKIAALMRAGRSDGEIAAVVNMTRWQVWARVNRTPELLAIRGERPPPPTKRVAKRKPMKLVEHVIEGPEVEPAPYRTATGCQFFAKGQEGIDGLVCNRPFHGGPLSRWCARHSRIAYAPPAERRAA